MLIEYVLDALSCFSELIALPVRCCKNHPEPGDSLQGGLRVCDGFAVGFVGVFHVWQPVVEALVYLPVPNVLFDLQENFLENVLESGYLDDGGVEVQRVWVLGFPSFEGSKSGICRTSGAS